MFSALLHAFQNKKPANIYEGVFLEIRLPRVLLCAITGAILSVSGVLLQGLFRNPIVEPGLIGTSAGAAFGASIVFVFAMQMSEEIRSIAGTIACSTFCLWRRITGNVSCLFDCKIAKENISNFFITGWYCHKRNWFKRYWFYELCCKRSAGKKHYFLESWNIFRRHMAAGFYHYRQLHLVVFIISLRYSKQLNALILGEEEASHLGIEPEKLKRRIMILSTAMVAVATAFVGVISFIGLIVPHILRLLIGSDNKKLIPASMIVGAIILTVADMGARLLLAPAEVPIGIITSIAGAPVFIFLLKKFNLLQEKGGSYA